MRTFLTSALLGLAFLIGAIQFANPARINPPTVETRTLAAAVQVPPAIKSILVRACWDCHSDDTVWPWYAHVSPISWYVVNHVDHGRRQVNFSEWLGPNVADPVQYSRQKLHSVCREVQLGHMPLYSYVIIHRTAALSPDDVQALCSWAESAISSSSTKR